MDTILLKYHYMGNDYLVYDTCKNDIALEPRTIRTICARNFSLGSAGLLAGSVMDDGQMTLKNYRPDGSEAEVTRPATRIFSQYLQDAGYPGCQYAPSTPSIDYAEISSPEKTGKEKERVEEIGKLFLSVTFIAKNHMNRCRMA